MTSTRSPTSTPPPTSPSTATDKDNPRPVTIVRSEVAGKALFSTMLGQVAPRPVPHPLEPIIARGPNNLKFEMPRQIERFVQQLRDDFPDQCNDIFVGYYTIGDYFDPYDIAHLGEEFLASTLDRIATQNSTAVHHFAYNWCQHNLEGVQKICNGTTLGEVFTEAEILEHGELFLTLGLIFIRNALLRTAHLQISRAKKTSGEDKSLHAETPSRVNVKPREDTSSKSHVPGPIQSRADQASSNPLYRVGLRQTQVDLTEPELAQPAAVPVGQCYPVFTRFRPPGQASNSVPVTPLLVHQSPALGQKHNAPKTTPRMQNYTPATVPSHQRKQSTPRMSAMAPGFIPQGSLGPPVPPGPPSRGITPQVAHSQLYLGSGPFLQGSPQVVHPELDVNALQRDPGLPPGYASYPGMQSSVHDFQAQMYASSQPGPRMLPGQLAGPPHAAGYMTVPPYSSPPMVPMNLANVTNGQFVAQAQNSRLRRVSGPGSRQDFGPRSQHKQIGKASRGGRRNSVRGNHHGPSFHPPGAGQPGFQGSPHFQHPVPVTTNEPFPPFMPPVETRAIPVFRPQMPNNREVRHSVWVHNINDELKAFSEDHVGAELRAHFELLLHRTVVDVKVKPDKNGHLYAHVNFSNPHDAEAALSLDGSNFYNRELMVKVPMREQRMRYETSQHQLPGSRDAMLAQLRPAQLNHTTSGQLTVSNLPGDSAILAAPVSQHRQSTLERRPSAAAVKSRSRGASRTYEATASNPMSYSPQDARRMQPVHSMPSKEPAKEAAQVAPPQASLDRPETPIQLPEQRPDSRASSTPTPGRKKRAAMTRRDRSSTRSRSSTTTPEPSATGSTDRGHTVRKQTPESFSAVGCGGIEGMVDKTITTIQESGDQEMLEDVTTMKEQGLEKPSSGKPSPAKKKNKKSKRADKRDEDKVSNSAIPDRPADSEFRAAGISDSSQQQKNTHERGTKSSSGRIEKPTHTQRTTKVAVPDITLHSRKEKQGAPSTASSAGRVSYAQAATVKTPVSIAAISAAAKSPASEQDTESRYFTPMEIPSSPSTKSDRTLGPATPMSTNTGRADETTPEKDDSFVTVQEEPPAALKGQEEDEGPAQQPKEQIIGNNVRLGTDDTPSTSPGQVESLHRDTTQGDALYTSKQQATSVEDVLAPEDVGSSSWADDAASHTEVGSTDIQSETEESAKVSENPRTEGPSAGEGAAKKNSQVIGSIHPLARQKGEKKKPPKKGKSYGKGKKATK